MTTRGAESSSYLLENEICVLFYAITHVSVLVLRVKVFQHEVINFRLRETVLQVFPFLQNFLINTMLYDLISCLIILYLYDPT